MNGLNALMRFAEQRGDGLLPELREFFAAETYRATQPNVVALLPRAGDLQQAGPNPVGTLPQDLPENIVKFGQRVVVEPECEAKPTIRAPGNSRAPHLLNQKS